MRLLLTRPQPESERLASALQGLGCEALIAPALSIEELAIQPSLIMDVDLYDLVIVTSKPAALRLVDAIDEVWPQLPIGLRALAVGPGTASILQDYHIPTDVAQPNNSEGVLVHPWVAQSTRVMLVTGRGGRGLIDQGLGQSGTQFTRVECYFRAQVRLPSAIERALLLNGVDATWITSSDALEAIINWPAAIQSQLGQIWVPSARVAEHAAGLGFESIRVLGSAADPALIEFIQKEAM